jgi:hypothetical protein
MDENKILFGNHIAGIYRVYSWNIKGKSIYLVYTWYIPEKNFLGVPDGLSESSESEFIWPSGSTRPAPPLPVALGGVHGGTASGAFISTSSSLQGIAKHKHKI